MAVITPPSPARARRTAGRITNIGGGSGQRRTWTTIVIGCAALAIVAMASLRLRDYSGDIGTTAQPHIQQQYREEGEEGAAMASADDVASSAAAIVPVKAGDRVLRGHMSPIVMEKYKLLFFYKPKVACTSFKVEFYSMLDKPLPDDLSSPLFHNPNKNELSYLMHYNLTSATRMMNDPTWTRCDQKKQRILSAKTNERKR